MKPTDRLPPGQVKTAKFPVLDLGIKPSFDPGTWRLRVKGEVEEALDLTYEQVIDLPATTSTSDFHCVTRWSRFDNRWEGILFGDLAARVKPKPAAQFVSFESTDGYSTSLPLAALMEDDVILAYRFDGADLTIEHGGPLRLVVPKKYAYKSAKWVRVIRFLAADELGYWEQRGYSNSADPWREERFS